MGLTISCASALAPSPQTLAPLFLGLRPLRRRRRSSPASRRCLAHEAWACRSCGGHGLDRARPPRVAARGRGIRRSLARRRKWLGAPGLDRRAPAGPFGERRARDGGSQLYGTRQAEECSGAARSAGARETVRSGAARRVRRALEAMRGVRMLLKYVFSPVKKLPAPELQARSDCLHDRAGEQVSLDKLYSRGAPKLSALNGSWSIGSCLTTERDAGSWPLTKLAAS